MTPDDELAFIGDPPLFRPEAGEVHVSVAFTWHKKEGERLADAWSAFYPNVKLGGPAFDDPGGEFMPGMYLKKGITITSRGCPRRCWFCYVPKREGDLRVLPIREGWIVQDNNFLACPAYHIRNVFRMLQRRNRAVTFAGGLDCFRLKEWHVDWFVTTKIKELWFAYDRPLQLEPLRQAIRFFAFLPRRKLRCYVLIGQPNDTLAKAEKRLREAWDAGTLPFAMLYHDDKGRPQSYEWRQLQRNWARPAAIFATMEGK